MQIKFTVRYNLTPIRMAIIKKSTTNKHWRGYREKGTLLHCWWEYKLVQPLSRIVWRFLKKLKIELPYDPTVPFLGIYLEKTKKSNPKATYTLMFIAALFTVAKTWKQSEFLLTETNICYHLFMESKNWCRQIYLQIETDSETNNKFMVTKAEEGRGIKLENLELTDTTTI